MGDSEREESQEGYGDSPLLAALARLNEIGAGINRISGRDAAGLQEVLALVVASAANTVPGAAAVLYMYDPGQRRFDPHSRVAAAADEWHRDDTVQAADYAPRPDGLGARATGQHRTILSYDEPDVAIHPAKTAAGAVSAACLPLVVAEQPEGALYVYLREDRHFSALELAMLQNLVNQAAIALYHARQVATIQRDLTRKEDELALLHDAGLLISSRTRLEETLEAILQMALEITGARYGIFRLVDRAGENLVTRAIAGDHLGRPAVETLPLNATSVMGWVAKTRQPLNIADVRSLPWSRIYYPLDHVLAMRSELAVPLVGASGRLEGVLNLESPQVGAFSEADSHLLQSLASQAVIAIQEVRLLDALRDTAARLLNQPGEQVLDHLADLACDLLNVDGSGIWTLERDELALRAARGVGRPDAPPQPPDEFIRGAIETTAPLTWEQADAPLAGAAAWVNGLATPLLAADDQRPVGVFAVYATGKPGRFSPSEWDKKILGILAHYAALALASEARQLALREAQEARAVAETFAAMGDVAANLLHHLNNKVGTIPVRIEGIQDKCASALAASPYLASNLLEIERAALDAMATVRERLLLLRPIEVAPMAVVGSVQDALSQARLPKSIEVMAEGLDGLPPVMAGRESLSLALVNLFENAREAMRGSGTIAIRAAAGPGWVELAVSDDGPGIASEQQPHIFDFSYSRSGRLDGGQGPSPTRLGFGLWWVKTLMTRLGGAISVESDGQNGATFRLRLPAANEVLTPT